MKRLTTFIRNALGLMKTKQKKEKKHMRKCSQGEKERNLHKTGVEK